MTASAPAAAALRAGATPPTRAQLRARAAALIAGLRQHQGPAFRQCLRGSDSVRVQQFKRDARGDLEIVWGPTAAEGSLRFTVREPTLAEAIEALDAFVAHVWPAGEAAR